MKEPETFVPAAIDEYVTDLTVKLDDGTLAIWCDLDLFQALAISSCTT